MADISKNTLMLVDDPKPALQALFEHTDGIISDKSYVEKYLSIKYSNDEDRIAGETKAETHLGTLRIYDLVAQIPSMAKGNNRITIKGKILRDIWLENKNWEKNDKFRRALSDLLLTNEHKGNLFKEFLKFVEQEKTKEEIKEKYKWRTAYTLIEWCQLAGLIAPVGLGRYKRVENTRKKPQYTTDEIWSQVKKSYEEIRRLDYDKKRLIIDFSDLRFRAAYNLGLKDPKDFDQYFLELMKSDYSQLINLHGGLTGEFNEEKNFVYKGRLYPGVSLHYED